MVQRLIKNINRQAMNVNRLEQVCANIGLTNSEWTAWLRITSTDSARN